MTIAILTLLVIVISVITTIPFSIGLLTISAILVRKSWIFFLALGLGLFLDLISIRVLGYTSLVLTIFVLLIRLYERKFETQTGTFVFISSFLGSLIYLYLFGYQSVFLQALINALFTILTFRLIQKLTKNHSSINELTG